MSNFQAFQVKLPSHKYNIYVGTGLEFGYHIKNLFPDSRVAIITDKNVEKHYGDTFRHNLDSWERSYETIVVDSGEQSKSWSVLEYVVEQILSHSFERNDVVVAFGGGVIGDLAGFASGIALRGMGFIQIPTTLLAQVDSAVGGKTGINGAKGKNLVGLFHQPSVVLSEVSFLRTLPDRELRSGYAEIAKYALINNSQYFSSLEEHWKEYLSNMDYLESLIFIACKAKSKIVEADEREKGDRALLNLGHTFGHALESSANYDSTLLTHGEAVSVGLVLAHQYSTRLGFCPKKDTERVKTHLSNVGLPTCFSDIKGVKFNVDKLMSAIHQDKKVKDGKLTFILSKGIGKAFIERDVSPKQIEKFLEEQLSL